MRRVLVDTNVIVSALLFPDSVPAEALSDVLSNQRLVLAEQVIEELHEVVARKRPDLLPALDDLLAGIPFETAAPAPSKTRIADIDDQLILDAAVAADVDVILTGDWHFLSLSLVRPAAVTPREYLDSLRDRP